MGRDDQYCPECGQRIWRLDGDFFLQCHRCGWTKGSPIIRWLTQWTWVQELGHRFEQRSRMRARTVGMILVYWAIVIALLQASVAYGPAVASDIGDFGATGQVFSNQSPESHPTTNQTAAPTSTSEDRSGFDADQVEAYFLQFLNEERQRRGLQRVREDDSLSAMGAAHSENMAKNGYFDHTEPDGETIEDRYRSRGLLPECRLPIQESDRYYPGAENIAYTYIDRRVEKSWEEGSVVISTEEELAKHLFEMWMHSPDHRKAMLVASADEAGLGLAFTESGKVYASLELC